MTLRSLHPFACNGFGPSRPFRLRRISEGSEGSKDLAPVPSLRDGGRPAAHPMTASRPSTMPASIFDTTLPTSTRRALLDRWWTACRREACQPRPLAMRVYADGSWWRSSPSRPTLAPALLAIAAAPKPASPSDSSAYLAERRARERWARTVLGGMDDVAVTG